MDAEATILRNSREDREDNILKAILDTRGALQAQTLECSSKLMKLFESVTAEDDSVKKERLTLESQLEEVGVHLKYDHHQHKAVSCELSACFVWLIIGRDKDRKALLQTSGCTPKTAGFSFFHSTLIRIYSQF